MGFFFSIQCYLILTFCMEIEIANRTYEKKTLRKTLSNMKTFSMHPAIKSSPKQMSLSSRRTLDFSILLFYSLKQVHKMTSQYR